MTASIHSHRFCLLNPSPWFQTICKFLYVVCSLLFPAEQDGTLPSSRFSEIAGREGFSNHQAGLPPQRWIASLQGHHSYGDSESFQIRFRSFRSGISVCVSDRPNKGGRREPDILETTLADGKSFRLSNNPTQDDGEPLVYLHPVEDVESSSRGWIPSS